MLMIAVPTADFRDSCKLGTAIKTATAVIATTAINPSNVKPLF